MTELTKHKRIYQVFVENDIVKVAEKNSKKAKIYQEFGGKVVKEIKVTLTWNPDNFVIADLQNIDFENIVEKAYQRGDTEVMVSRI